MTIETMEDVYVEELLDLYDAERQLVAALAKMAEAASTPELRTAFEEHLEETHEHIRRLEQILRQLDVTPNGKPSRAIEQLIEESEERIARDSSAEILDAALIAAAQHVEHYEIAGYGCARTYARHLAFDNAADLLQQTLDEENAFDSRLTGLAESVINVEAVIKDRNMQ